MKKLENLSQMYTWYFIDNRIILQTARGLLNSLICVVHFSNDFISVFHKKVHETYWCSRSVTCQEQIGYLEYSLLMIKIHYISP